MSNVPLGKGGGGSADPRGASGTAGDRPASGWIGPPSERKHGLSTEQFPVSAYRGSLKNPKDLKAPGDGYTRLGMDRPAFGWIGPPPDE